MRGEAVRIVRRDSLRPADAASWSSVPTALSFNNTRNALRRFRSQAHQSGFSNTTAASASCTRRFSRFQPPALRGLEVPLMKGLYTKTGQAPVFCWSAPCPNPSSGSPSAWHWPTWLGWWCWRLGGTQMSASDELMRLEHRLESLGIGYTRMELCIIELSRQIQALVEQNAAMLQALADEEEPDDQGEPVGYLSSKRR